MEFREWMRKLNGKLLSEINLGTWSLDRRLPYQQWYDAGFTPGRVANLIIDMVSMGKGLRRRRRR